MKRLFLDHPILRLFITWLIIVFCAIIVNTIFPDRTPPGRDTCVIGYEQGARRVPYDECDSTDAYVFYLYGNTGCMVDAYNLDGEFQFTLFFTDSQNGVMHIRCENNLLYVSTKKDSVFIFDGDQQIEKLTHQEASEQGYTWNWFMRYE